MYSVGGLLLWAVLDPPKVVGCAAPLSLGQEAHKGLSLTKTQSRGEEENG